MNVNGKKQFGPWEDDGTTASTDRAVSVGGALTVQGSAFQNSADGHAAFGRKVYSGSASITAAASITLNLAHAGAGTVIPSGERIVAYYLHVKTALAAGEVWDAELNDGAQVLPLASGAAVAQNTNVSGQDTAETFTDDDTAIVVTKNGGGAFTAQGLIEAVVITEGWTAWSDE